MYRSGQKLNDILKISDDIKSPLRFGILGYDGTIVQIYPFTIDPLVISSIISSIVVDKEEEEEIRNQILQFSPNSKKINR